MRRVVALVAVLAFAVAVMLTGKDAFCASANRLLEMRPADGCIVAVECGGAERCATPVHGVEGADACFAAGAGSFSLRFQLSTADGTKLVYVPCCMLVAKLEPAGAGMTLNGETPFVFAAALHAGWDGSYRAVIGQLGEGRYGLIVWAGTFDEPPFTIDLRVGRGSG